MNESGQISSYYWYSITICVQIHAKYMLGNRVSYVNIPNRIYCIYSYNLLDTI